MRPSEPRSWLLDGAAGWRGGSRVGVAESATGIRLAALPAGALGLQSRGGRASRELAGLTLPRGMAFDRGWTLHLLTRRDGLIRRYDAERRRLTPLPAIGGLGSGTRQFRRPRAIAIAGELLYVVDVGDDRVLAFDLRTFALQHLWTTAHGQPWRPVDVVEHAGAAYILDGGSGRVVRHRPGTERLEQAVAPVRGDGPWSRLAIDRDGRFSLLAARAARLAQVAENGAVVAVVADAGDVRDRFEPPPIRRDERGRFCLAPSLARECDRRPPEPAPTAPAPLAACEADACGLVFGADGERIRALPEEPIAPALFEQKGVWVSAALDSGVVGCQWRRVELDLGALPVGSQVEIGTFATDTLVAAEAMRDRALELWDRVPAFVGESPRPDRDGPRGDGGHELLVQSPPGQYLWLRVALAGDGRMTPVVRGIRIHFAGESYLQYLPAVFSEDEESRWFLERFLALFQSEWDTLERTIAELPRIADPATVPAGFLLANLAGWLGLPLEGAWDDEQKRRLLEAAPGLYQRRGTVGELRDYLRVYLHNITGVDPAALPEVPAIVEGYRERDHLMLCADDGGALGAGPPLWSPHVVGRLQLGVDARADEGRLIGTNDPERDVFHHYAHQFRVFVPAVWVGSDEAEQMVRRALDDEKPGHARYDLCLVESRFQIGLQSTLGLDAIIGDYPVVRLACHANDAAADARRTRGRLGYDTILACADDAPPAARLAPGLSLGSAFAIG